MSEAVLALCVGTMCALLAGTGFAGWLDRREGASLLFSLGYGALAVWMFIAWMLA